MVTIVSVNIFITGDLHIPSRAAMLHPHFERVLLQQQWDYIVLTGDLTIPSVLHRFEKLVSSPKKLIVARGNMDQMTLPLKPTFEIDSLRLGAFHGTDVHPRGDIPQLKKIADEMGVKILFTGHSHKTFIHSDTEHIILNPGTSTGASGGTSWSVDTALITMEINFEKSVILLKWLKINNKGKLEIEKITINL